jgi:uncharacterized protein YuzE
VKIFGNSSPGAVVRVQLSGNTRFYPKILWVFALNRADIFKNILILLFFPVPLGYPKTVTKWLVISEEDDHDPKHDLLNIEFISEETIAESVELDGVIIDYSQDGKIVAIEILDAGKRTTKNPLDLIDLAIVREKAVA